MGQHILPGNPPIDVILRRSARARRITLRVSGLDGRVTLTLPKGVSEREALDFARSKETWVRKHLEAKPEVSRIEEGAFVLIEGVAREVVAAPSRRVVLDAARVQVPLAGGQGGARLKAWLQARARLRLTGASDHYSAKLGRPYSRLTLRDTRSRWGSCSAQGGLNYSWRLILAPPNVLDYVAAHEVAHLQEMNHSPAFWAVVEQLFGPCEAERRWLRKEGAALHAIDFTGAS